MVDEFNKLSPVTMPTRPGATTEWNSRAREDLRNLVSPSRPILLVGRASSWGSRAAAGDAVDDLLRAARGLASRGFDVRALLPSKAELIELLMGPSAVRVQSVDRESNEFENWFVCLDYSRFGFVVALSSGSAAKTTERSVQPHVLWIAHLLALWRATGFYASRLDRVARVDWQVGLVIDELAALESRFGAMWAQDGDGEWGTSDTARIMLMLRASQARTDGRQIVSKTIQGRLDWTGASMADGRVEYALSTALPPGFFTFKDKWLKHNLLSLDTPGLYPKEGESMTTLPRVLDPSGREADQVANVRWVLSVLGKPGVSRRDVVEGLVRRGYSTNSLRHMREYDNATAYGSALRPVDFSKQDSFMRVLKPFLKNLDLYETGVLRQRLSGDLYVEVSNLFPLDGSWALPEDFARIRAMKIFPQRSQALWLSGLPVKVDGRPGKLRTYPTNGAGSAVQPWTVRPTDGGPAFGLPAFGDDVFTAAVVDAVVAAGDRPLDQFVSSEQADARVEQAHADAARLTAAATTAERDWLTSKAAFKTNSARDGADPELLAEFEADAKRDRAVFADVSAELAIAREAVARLATRPPGVDRASLRGLVDDLRSADTSKPKAVLRAGLRDVTVTSTKTSAGRLRGLTVRVAGQLVVDEDGAAGSVPFGFTYTTGAALDSERRIQEVVGLLRAGQVVRNLRRGVSHQMVGNVAELFGLTKRQTGLFTCGDPLLLQLAMAVTFPDPVPGEDPAQVVTVEALLDNPEYTSTFGNVPALVNRVREVYAKPRHCWLNKSGGRTAAHALVLAATGETRSTVGIRKQRERVRFMNVEMDKPENRLRRQRWVFTPGSWPALLPCEFCGSTRAAGMRIPEVSGYLCLNPTCRLDQAGVRWPSSYDRYVERLPIWLDAGFEFDLPDGFNGDPAAFRGIEISPVAPQERRWRRLADLSEAERAAICADYADRSIALRTVQARHRVTGNIMYKVVREAGMVMRQAKHDPTGRGIAELDKEHGDIALVVDSRAAA